MRAANKGADDACEMRAAAREIYRHALAESSIEEAFERKIYYERGILQVGEDLFGLADYARIFVLAVGKAAHGSVEALTRRLGGGVELEGIVSSPVPLGAKSYGVRGFRYYEGGHPLPNDESLRAAEAALRTLDSLDEQSLVIYLISGGGSAAMEKPVSEEIAFADLVETHRVLVQSGAPIAEINALRKHLSAVKGGRLAVAAAPAQQLSILISDVGEDALDSVASGPTMPDRSTASDCYAIAERYELLPQLPASVREMLRGQRLEETPKSDDAAFVGARWWPVLSNETALKAAAARAAEMGFAVEIDNRCDDWDYARAGDYLLQRIRELRTGAGRVCLLSGGEVTVKIGGSCGVGGRNQQLALYCAQRMEGERLCLLSAGSDGVDGNSPAAGAVVDGGTMARAQERGLTAEAALRGFDSYPFFAALGDTVMTGATGTNVRDVRILLVW